MTDKTIQLQGSLWMTIDGQPLGGADRMALLAQIAACGSITRAAKAAGMSYKAAWDAIDTMNNLAGEPLVARLAGGKGGGGTQLTARGEQLLHNFHTLQAEHQRFVHSLASQAPALADDYVLIRKMAMRTSARNQFAGTVEAVKHGAVNDEVTLLTPAGQRIVAIVTHDSVLGLGLQPGAQALALVKASSIMLVADAGSARFSARNQLHGEIARIQPGAVNTEVVIALPGGSSVAAVVTHDSCDTLALAVGQPASALFKASSVILAVPA